MPRAIPSPTLPVLVALAFVTLAWMPGSPRLAAQGSPAQRVPQAPQPAPEQRAPQVRPAAAAPAAPDVAVTSVTGERLGEAEMARGATIVVVWAAWSPRCHDIVDRVKALAGHWQSRAKVVTVDFEEDRQAVAAFLAGKDLGAPIFLDSDGAFSKKYAIATLPGLLVVKEGKVGYHGRLPDDPDRVVGEIVH
jgi:thiol-disulfide isomerase/thioredoxin